MLASAFCTKLWQFFITQVNQDAPRISTVSHLCRLQGLLEGIAAALIFPLVVRLTSSIRFCHGFMKLHLQMALPAQWFLKYRAFATGIVIAGASLGRSYILVKVQ